MTLTDFLNKYNMLQAEFAKSINETPMNVSRWVHGTIPSPETMAKIVAYTKGEVTANDFYGIEEKEVINNEQSS